MVTKADLDQLLSDESAPNSPESLPMRGTSGPRDAQILSATEMRRRRETVASLMISGHSRDRIVAMMGRDQVPDGKGGYAPWFSMSEKEVDRTMAIVRAEWDEEESEQKKYAKATAVRRLLREIEEARERKNYSAIANLEKVLMQVQGTSEPLQIASPGDGRITDALLRLIGEHDPVRVRILIEQERRIEFESSKAAPKLPMGEIDMRSFKRTGPKSEE